MRAKWFWHWPRQSDVLIYDAVRLDTLMEYLNSWHPEVLHLRGEQIYIRVLLKSLLRGGVKTHAYIDCFVEKVRPRLVVTFVDNDISMFFCTISQRHPEVKTLLIQNGWRDGTEDFFSNLEKMDFDTFGKFHVDYMLTFGSLVGGKYSQYIQGNTVPIGSITNNRVVKESMSQRGVLAFVSQCSFFRLLHPEDPFVKADRFVVPCLVRYAEKKNKRLMIIPKYHKDGELCAMEKAYFRGLLGSEPEYLKTDGLFSGYQAVDSADVVVSIGSTLGYESIARGNKTAHFSIRDIMEGLKGFNFGWPGNFPDEGLFWTNNPDADSFVRILDYLFEIDDEQWRKDIEEIKFPSLMVFDPGNAKLKYTLQKVLGSPAVFED